MTRTAFGYEGTDGAVATPGAVGAQQQASGTWTFNTQLARLEGATGLRVVTTGAQTTIMRFMAAAANAAISVGCAVRVDQLPPKTFTVFLSIRSTGSGTALRVIWKTDGTVAVRGTGTTTPEVLADNRLTIGKMYWVTVVLSIMSGAVIRFYDPDTKTLAATINTTGAMFGFGSTNFNAVDIGFVNGDPVVGASNNYDSLIINDGATDQQFPDSWSATVIEGTVWRGGALTAGYLRAWRDGAQTDLVARVG
jgi:hypothetical protein